MTFYENSAFSAHASYCASQASLAKDAVLKKHWDDLADDWIALDSTMEAIERCRAALPKR